VIELLRISQYFSVKLSHIYRYRGHCPTTKYDYGETYGNATAKYFQDYRSEVLSASADPYCKGGDFPTYYTHKPETVISNRTRTRDRWLHTPKYSLTNIDFDRKEELKSFDKVCMINALNFINTSCYSEDTMFRIIKCVIY
jgi:hypothetical protein